VTGLARVLLSLGGAGFALWGALALWFTGPGPAPLRAALGALVLAAAGWGLARRSLGAAALALAALAALLLGWWSTLRPSGERDWTPDVARAPTAEIAGDQVTVRNVRDFRYRSETDFDARWEDRTYDLSRVRSLDLFLSYWGSPHIAHTILSWGFDDGRHLAISIETRKERGESYSALAGFFRRYELVYVAADERDLIALRTNHRGEDVYLYRLRPRRPEGARELLQAYLQAMNELAARPAWYNALATNCTTTIRLNVLHAGGELPVDWRLLANGHLPELLYERGVVDTSLPVAELRAHSAIGARARAAGDGPDFSARLRVPAP
jgi:hypothetical protein